MVPAALPPYFLRLFIATKHRHRGHNSKVDASLGTCGRGIELEERFKLKLLAQPYIFPHRMHLLHQQFHHSIKSM